MTPGELPRRRQSVGNLGLQFGALGSLSLTHVIQQFRDQPSLAVTTIAYGVPLPAIGHLSVSAVHTAGSSASNALFTTLAIPFGEAASASAGLERTHDRQTGRRDNHRVLAVQKSLPLGDGYGYRFNARDDNLLGSVSRQTGYGTYTAEAARSEDGQTATRLSASGGIGVIGGHAFLSRSITDSFAVVRVADFAGVRVLHDNQVAARTDPSGYAVLPRLRPYDRNRVAVDQSDLPFEASIGTLELPAVPYFRSGVYIEFPVRRVRAGTLRIVLEDGADLPSGALARIDGQEQQFPVALGGQAYVEGFEAAANRLHVTWREQSCVLDVSYPAGADPLPDLGVFICKGVKP
jgi:outer membrane usher protein